MILCAWPYLHQPRLWLFFLFIGVTHYIQDWAKIKFTTGQKHSLLFYVLDQLLHVMVIAAIFLTDLRSLHPPVDAAAGSFAQYLYNSNTFILYLNALIVASYAGHFSIVLFRQDYYPVAIPNNPFENAYGMAERALIVSLFFMQPVWLLLIPFILALRFLIFKQMNDNLNLPAPFVSLTEIMLSGGIAITAGLIFYPFTP